MERFEVPGTARASLGMYNTLAEVDAFADALERIVAAAKPRVAAPANTSYAYPGAKASNPTEAAAELAEFFDFVEDWTEKYEYIIDLGRKLPPLPDHLRTEANRVRGCQSTVFLDLRKKPNSPDIVEFLADSDADIVRGLIAILQALFSGQRARDVAAFDIDAFFRRIGLDKNLTMGRRNGLAEMTNAGIPVPPGYTITTAACRQFFEAGGRLLESIVQEEREVARTLAHDTDAVAGRLVDRARGHRGLNRIRSRRGPPGRRAGRQSPR